jgi:RNA polymerase sigma-70 factor (ECF subfamily)
MSSYDRKVRVPRRRNGTTGASVEGPERTREADAFGPEPSGELLGRVAAGDLAALGELYQALAESVYQLSYSLTGSVADAEDVVQDLFVGLPDVLGSLRSEENFHPWLMKCTVRASLAHMRATRRRREIKLEPEWLVGSTPPVDERLDLEAAINRLPDTLRLVVVLREIQGYPYTEIGEFLQITATASRVRMMRARQALRHLLGSSLDEDG